MDRDRYFVERCKIFRENKDRRLYTCGVQIYVLKYKTKILLLEYRVQISALYSKTKIILLEYRVQIFYLKAEDYPYPN